MLSRLFAPKVKVSAHCDLPCGVYDPAQARIEAESCYKIIQKYNDSTDDLFRARSPRLQHAYYALMRWFVGGVYRSNGMRGLRTSRRLNRAANGHSWEMIVAQFSGLVWSIAHNSATTCPISPPATP